MTSPPAVPRTNVYVDGFNFYYGAMKNTPYKWCDIATLFNLLLPRNSINRIRYFTAAVHARPSNPNVHVRQQTYLRALQTIPNLSLHLGTFRQTIVNAPVVSPVGTSARYVNVYKTEEKGSDVNLASFLLTDSFNEDFEVAVVVSNDTDLITPIEMVVRDMGRPVGLLNPHPKPARDLLKVATFYKPIRPGVLAASQFPTTLTDSTGTFHKPANW